jgi:predicted phage tail protein
VSASGWSILGTWTPVGGAATSHTLQIAANASFSPVLMTQTLGAGPSFSLEAPAGTTGTFYFRVRATNAYGSSLYTSGVAVSLPGVPSAPGAPVLQNAVVSGTNVTLNWGPGPGGAPASYTLLVGSSSGASNVGAFPMGSATSIAAGAPYGTYYARVQASNVSGSAISNEISFTVGAPCVPTGVPTSVSASRAGNVITVSWAAPSGSAPFAYTIVAGTSAGASNLGTFPVGSATTISAPVPAGSYFIRVRAANACGTSGDSSEVSVSVP